MSFNAKILDKFFVVDSVVKCERELFDWLDLSMFEKFFDNFNNPLLDLVIFVVSRLTNHKLDHVLVSSNDLSKYFLYVVLSGFSFELYKACVFFVTAGMFVGEVGSYFQWGIRQCQFARLDFLHWLI